MATEEPVLETRERQVSTYDDLNALTFGALKRLASDNAIRLAKFPKKHDIIKQILIQAESNEELAAAVAAALPDAPHVSSSPRPTRQSSREPPPAAEPAAAPAAAATEAQPEPAAPAEPVRLEKKETRTIQTTTLFLISLL